MRPPRSRALSALVLIPLLLASAACDSNDDSAPPLDTQSDRLAAMVAFYATDDDGFDGERKLVLFNVDEPERFIVVEEAGTQVVNPCLSDSKDLIVYEDHSSFGPDGAALYVYDVQQEQARKLAFGGEDLRGELLSCVWNPDDSGFFFTIYGPAGITASLHYDLNTGEARRFGPETQFAVASIPIARLPDGTIVARTSNPDIVQEWVPESVTGGAREPVPAYYVTSFPDHQVLRYIEVPGMKNEPWQNREDARRSSSVFRYTVRNEEYDQASGTFGYIYRNQEGEERGVGTGVLGGDGGTRITEKTANWVNATLIGAGRLLAQARDRTDGDIRYDNTGIEVIDMVQGTARVLIEPDRISGADGLLDPDF